MQETFKDAIANAASKRVVTVQVKELVEFTLRTGDLRHERGFTRKNRALAGTLGHHQVQRSRPEGYEKEVCLSYGIETDRLILRVQGRLDGLLIEGDRVLLEEIKTVTGLWDGKADALHWAQLQVYGFIYASERRLPSLTLQLTYLNLDTDGVTEFRKSWAMEELNEFFQRAASLYLRWIEEYLRRCDSRDASIRTLDFPFRYREGQRELAVAVYRAISQKTRLFVEAPTGIGKTISVLFPALKALSEGKVERLFYLTARGTGRAAAEKAFEDLRASGLSATTLTLTAKDKVCIRDGQPCDVLECPLARGYYDRRHRAMEAAFVHQELSRSVLEEIAHEYQVCPFELALDLSLWVDTVICDFNYVFDPTVWLRRHFSEEQGPYAFLVDEAHNLLDRSREMFSAELDNGQIQALRRAIQPHIKACARALSKLSAALRRYNAGTKAAIPEPNQPDSGDLFSVAAPDAEAIPERLQDPSDCLEALVPLVEKAAELAEDWLVRNEESEFRTDLLDLYFRFHSFLRTAERYDEHYAILWNGDGPVRVKLYCLDPSQLIADALQRARASVFFSATLTPIEYYREVLGGESSDPILQLASPFPSHHLAVIVQSRLQTHFKARAESLADVVEAIGNVVLERTGNYLVYFPSYQYLSLVYEQFQLRFPNVRTRVQRPGMTDSDRAAFLEAFSLVQTEGLAGFAVLGGVFGEGVDLVGERLIGVVVVGVGLPQLSPERDLVRDYFQKKGGSGFDYAYTFPGMNRVLQATGRVIRSETDRGVVLLIDARFAQWRYRRLFPRWWRTTGAATPAQLRDHVRQFWETAL